ncbi:MAG: 4Fe-4S dicluster domain-containing protein [Candidatus Bathyarchaeia archaeon]
MSEQSQLIEVKEPIKTTQLDPKFKFEVAKMPGGENILYCFQCGKCSATCPVRRFDNNYQPRLIIRATLLGLREIVLCSDVIWLCAACYSCTQRCPQGVRITDIMQAIRNLAVKKGHVPPFFKIQADTIASHGRIYSDVSFINEQRTEIGLPPLQPINLEEISKILKNARTRKLPLVEKAE